MAKIINNLSDLKGYILRRLGSPVNEIEISEEQMEDRIDDAIQKFYTFHYDGINIQYIIIDLIPGQTDYQMTDTVVEVLDILTSRLNFNYFTSDDFAFAGNSYFANNFFYNFYGDPLQLEIFRQQRELFNDTYQRLYEFDYNRTTNILRVFAPPQSTIKVAIKVYSVEDNQDDILNNEWIRDYASALCKKQWAVNIQKYGNINLPGGAKFNYDIIMEQAMNEIDKLLIELKDEFSYPGDAFFE